MSFLAYCNNREVNISNEQLEEFIRIYKEKFNVELSREEAYEKAIKLLNLASLLYDFIASRIAQE